MTGQTASTMSVVTLSASYGAGGSHVGPALAERLGATFLDRAIPAAVAEQLAVPLDEVVARDETTEGLLGRLLARLAPLSGVYGAGMTSPAMPLEDEDYAHATARVIRERAERGSVVVLGRAGAVVLRDVPGAFHVRLDGPRERRVAHAAEREGVDPQLAERRCREADRARTAYVKALHRCDPADPSLYHLVIDSTAIPLGACVELIVAAHAAFAEG